MTVRRLASLALLLLLPLTLAPRTSLDIGNGWRVLVISDTFGRTQSPVSVLSFKAVAPSTPSVVDLTLHVSGGAWTLVKAPAGCSAVTGGIECVMDSTAMRPGQVFTVTVRSAGAPLAYTFSAQAPV